jgi:putative phosphotransacetylase
MIIKKDDTMELISENMIDQIVKEIKQKIFVEVEASGRHVHLTKEDVEFLFGANYQLTKLKDLSQPGQYACKERVSVTGPKGTINNVIVLGPERKETQVEVSLTDALVLGIKAPIKQSGHIENTPGAVISYGDKKIEISKGVIVAKRHIHLHPTDANRFHLVDGEIVKLKVFGERPLIFDDVVARVHENFATYVHIDYDEANACGFTKGTLSIILKHNN